MSLKPKDSFLEDNPESVRLWRLHFEQLCKHSKNNLPTLRRYTNEDKGGVMADLFAYRELVVKHLEERDISEGAEFWGFRDDVLTNHTWNNPDIIEVCLENDGF